MLGQLHAIKSGGILSAAVENGTARPRRSGLRMTGALLARLGDEIEERPQVSSAQTAADT